MESSIDPAALPPFPPELRARLEARYREPQRRYDALAHVQALQRWLAHWQPLAQQPVLIDAAIWFHDAIYEPRRDDNEARSAQLARTELAAIDWPAAAIDRVAALVLATQHHAAPEDDSDLHLFLDLDLSVLGQRAEAYDAYAAAVRAEYAGVDDTAYRAGRARVLRGFLARAAIYRTPALHAAWEGAARANLARELQALEAGPGDPGDPAAAGQSG